MGINKNNATKNAIYNLGLISLEPINFSFLDLFSPHGNFPILEFQARQWRLVGRRTGIAWGDHRPPLQSPEGAAQTWWKRYFWAIMTKYFFLICMKHNPNKILRNSFVADCYWIHPMMLKLFAKKEEHNLKTKLSRSKSIVSFKTLSLNRVVSKYTSRQTSWERENKCTCLTICVVQYGSPHSQETSFSHLYLR